MAHRIASIIGQRETFASKFDFDDVRGALAHAKENHLSTDQTKRLRLFNRNDGRLIASNHRETRTLGRRHCDHWRADVRSIDTISFALAKPIKFERV